MEGRWPTYMRGPFFAVVPAFRRGFRRGEWGPRFFIAVFPVFSNIKPQHIMKRLKWPLLPPNNLLHVTHVLFMQAMNGFRDKVVEECGWSVPTFYRKMRDQKSLSNAEKDKILQIALQCVKHQYDFCSKLADDHKTGRLSAITWPSFWGNTKP